MSWSFTVNDMTTAAPQLDEELLGRFRDINDQYPLDMAAAWNLARTLGVRSATLTGARTPTPYNDDEVVMVTITGLTNSEKFFETMRKISTQREPGE